DAVRSRAVSEPGSLRVAAGHPAVDEVIAHGEELYRRRASLSPGAFLRQFRTGVHSTHETPDALPDWLEHGARLVMEERPPWEADIPVERLAPPVEPNRQPGQARVVARAAHQAEDGSDVGEGLGDRRDAAAGRHAPGPRVVGREREVDGTKAAQQVAHEVRLGVDRALGVV